MQRGQSTSEKKILRQMLYYWHHTSNALLAQLLFKHDMDQD